MTYKTPPSGGIVCLRCQLRLFHPLLPRRPSLFLSPRVFSRHTSRNGYAALAKPQAWKGGLILGSPRRLHHAASEEGESRAPQPESERPELEHEHEPDELLSDEATQPDKAAMSDEATRSEMAEIWNSLLEEDTTPTADEVSEHINELRPTDETTLTRTEFQKRADSLTDGFTVTQLHEYIRANRKPASRPAAYAWEVQQQPWVPDGVVAEATAASSSSSRAAKPTKAAPGLLLRGYVEPSMTSKEKLAVQLMRECWGLSVRELMDAPGLLDVTVRDVEFALLAAGAQTWLRDISTAYSTVTTTTAVANRSRSRSHSRGQTRQHRHIELDPGQRLLRIFAPAATADAILADIDRLLSQAATRSFRLSDVAGPHAVAAVGPDVLRALGTMTESWVRLGDTRQTKGQVLVSWIAPAAAQDGGLEDTGDRVYRLLLTAYGSTALPQTTELDYEPLKRTKARLLSEFDVASRSTWPWAHRQTSWARLVEPCLADATAARTRLPAKVPGAQSLRLEFVPPNAGTTTPAAGSVADGADVDAGEDAESPAEDPSKKWYRLIRTATVATFGRVLHAAETNSILTELDDLPAAAPSLKDLQRILSPMAPPLLGISLPAPSTEATPSTTLLLRFLPRPDTPLAHCAPPLEVYLDVPAAAAAGQPVVTALHTVMTTHTSDVLFPTQPVDVRITQKRFFALPGADIAAEPAMGPLRAFLEQAHLGRSPLSTPSLLPGLGLPARVLLPVGEGAKLREQPRKRHDTTAVDYVFAGLEVRRRVATAFEGWTLALTSVDAGRGGGRHTALTLEAAPAGVAGVSEPVATGGDLSKAAFRHAVGRLVHGDAIKWQMPGEELK